MSNTNETLSSIEASDLTTVHGGYEAEVTIPGPNGNNTGRLNTNYSTCQDRADQRAATAHPDNRWFWQRWMGQPDPNAGPRAEMAARLGGACTQR